VQKTHCVFSPKVNYGYPNRSTPRKISSSKMSLLKSMVQDTAMKATALENSGDSTCMAVVSAGHVKDR
jgi:hypothetical protein